MNKKLMKIIVLSLFSLLVPTVLWGQNNERKTSKTSELYLISARAGGVNYLSGQVSVERNNKKSGFLIKGDTVEVGEKVVTDADGKAEILLNPGSYIRLGGNSSFEFLSTSLDDLQIQINKGSAIFEVIADKEFTVTIKMPNSKFYLISAGVFRVDVLESGDGRISVYKGKAQVGDTKATVIKGGRTATQNGNTVAVAKFDRDDKTELDNWSRDRAKEIAKVNSNLMRQQMRQSLLSSFNNNVWNTSNGYGLWVQDPLSRSFCFLPFGWGWSSPYGFGYRQSIWNYNPPPQMMGPIYQNPNVNNSSGSQNGWTPPPTVSNPSNNSPGNSGGSGNGSNNNVYQPPTREIERPVNAEPRVSNPVRGRPIDN